MMPAAEPRLPRLPAALLRVLLPYAEREEVLADLADEYRTRVRTKGSRAGRRWAWRQVLGSMPALARRTWWRGWSGFEPQANRWQPGGGMLENGVRDLKYALRRLQKRPAYTVLTALTLSLGVAGTAAIYSIAKQLLLEPLPYRAEEEVVVFWSPLDWSEAEFEYLRPQMEGFRSVAAYRSADVTLQRGDAPALLVRGVSASAELFQVLGVNPAMGPGLRSADDRLGAEPVVVLSHALWRSLGGDQGIVGERVVLAGVPRTVVGVMPRGFWFPDPTVQAWLSEEMDPENGVGNYVLIGRMDPGRGSEGMAGPLQRITTLLGERFTYPEQWDKTRNAQLTPVREYLIGSVRPALLAMLAAMAVILLIACVNVAALMLGQVDTRATELAVRSALGARRQQLLQALLVESLVIGVLAGLIGTGLAIGGFRFLVAALPLGALAENATLNWTLFASAIGIAVLAASTVSLVPALSVARADLQTRLTRTRTAGIGGRGGRLEGALVVAQVALVLLMASGAALLIRSVANLRALDPGLETQGVGVIDVVMPVTTEAQRRPQLLHELLEAVESVPGVGTVGATQRLPLRGGGDNWGLVIEGRPELESTTTAFRLVTPGYFHALGVPLRSGRGLLETDRTAGQEGVVVINQALVDRFFSGVDPLGQRLGSPPGSIVGVIDNVAETELSDEPVPARYMVYDQVPSAVLSGQTIVFRMQGGRDPAPVLDAARRAIQAAHPGVAVRELTTMASVFDQAIGPARQVMALLTLLGALALALGVIGVYGVVSHFVTRRKRDWGIRIALGLRPARVIQQIVGQGGVLVGTGIILGLFVFAVLARLLASFLYGVGATDPLALGAATAILLAAGLLAAYIPARRASRTDPALVLREQ